MRQAVITFDPERIADWDIQAEGQAIAYAIKSALTEKGFVETRGMLRIDVMPEPVFNLPDESEKGPACS